MDVSQPDARATVLSDYVQFLTTPASHNDTYAESCHRSFFSDWQDSRPASPRQVNQTRPGKGTPLQTLVPLGENCSDLLSPGSCVCRETFQAKAELHVCRQPAGRHWLPSRDPPLHPAVCNGQWGSSCGWQPLILRVWQGWTKFLAHGSLTVSSDFCSCGIREADPSSPQGAWVCDHLQPRAACRPGRCQHSPASWACSPAAGFLGHLPELQPQSRQVAIGQCVETWQT